MTKDKAIEILAKHVYGGSVTLNEEFKEAERLGIEALKAIKQLWNSDPEARIPKSLLPGETES